MRMSFRTYRRDVNPFETDTKGGLFVTDVSIKWPNNRNWQSKELDLWKATQLNLLHQKSVYNYGYPVNHNFFLSTICVQAAHWEQADPWHTISKGKQIHCHLMYVWTSCSDFQSYWWQGQSVLNKVSSTPLRLCFLPHFLIPYNRKA